MNKVVAVALACAGAVFVCARGCFAKWLIEEDKYQREKNLEKFEK